MQQNAKFVFNWLIITLITIIKYKKRDISNSFVLGSVLKKSNRKIPLLDPVYA